jgi:hypothetical protein
MGFGKALTLQPPVGVYRGAVRSPKVGTNVLAVSKGFDSASIQLVTAEAK